MAIPHSWQLSSHDGTEAARDANTAATWCQKAPPGPQHQAPAPAPSPSPSPTTPQASTPAPPPKAAPTATATQAPLTSTPTPSPAATAAVRPLPVFCPWPGLQGAALVGSLPSATVQLWPASFHPPRRRLQVHPTQQPTHVHGCCPNPAANTCQCPLSCRPFPALSRYTP